MTFSKVRFFGLLIIFLIIATTARSAEKFKEAWIFSFCKSADTFSEVSSLFKQGDVTPGQMHYQAMVATGECLDYTQYGWALSFIGEEIIARHNDPYLGKTVVLSGHVINKDESKGPKVFVWVAEDDLHNFITSIDGKPVFAPEPPKFKGFHKGRQDA